MNPHTYGHLIFDKGAKTIQWKKRQHFQQMVLAKLIHSYLLVQRIFTNPKSDRRIITNIYKELKKVDSRNSNNPIKKWGSELNKEFSPEEY